MISRLTCICILDGATFRSRMQMQEVTGLALRIDRKSVVTRWQENKQKPSYYAMPRQPQQSSLDSDIHMSTGLTYS
jgi:hypothetical protein